MREYIRILELRSSRTATSGSIAAPSAERPFERPAIGFECRAAGPRQAAQRQRNLPAKRLLDPHVPRLLQPHEMAGEVAARQLALALEEHEVCFLERVQERHDHEPRRLVDDAIHAGELAGYKVCGYNNTGYDFSHVEYPGKLENCEGCHLPDTYYPPDSTLAIATTIDAGPDRSTPAGDVAITAGSAACSACHVDAPARQHMELNGGSFGAVKAADSTTPGAPIETCSNCHGPGKLVDVKIEHGVGEFRYNE